MHSGVDLWAVFDVFERSIQPVLRCVPAQPIFGPLRRSLSLIRTKARPSRLNIANASANQLRPQADYSRAALLVD
jgi:hypothetical protein